MSRHEEGFFPAHDNLRLFWERTLPEAPRAHVGVAHGYADHAGRWRPTLDALAEGGFAAHAFDFRGHGQSDGRRGHCDVFSEFVDDLDRFWSRLRADAAGRPTFLMAHSHGALVALRWMQKRPEGVRGLILSSPFLQLAFTPPKLKVWSSLLVGRLVPWLPVAHPLTPEQLTLDPQAQRAVEKDPLYNRVVTPRWFTQMLHAQEEARRSGPSLDVPLLIVCSPDDPVASTAVGRRFFETVKSDDKTWKEYPGRRHEVMNDQGKQEVWRDITNWISQHL